MTTQCMEECLKRGIIVNYFSKRGVYYGCLESTRNDNVFRVKKQIKLTEDKEFSLKLTKRIIKAKIHNQRVVLKRYINEETRRLQICVNNIKNSEDKIDKAESIEQVMGYEGFASRNYFDALSQVIRKEFKFQGRNRMPPRDPFNSMLSLGYTILMYEVYGQIISKGLYPYAGFMHKDRERHPTLASDLMEEWGAVVVDSVVMSLIQGNEISICDFDITEDGVFLSDKLIIYDITDNKKKLKFSKELEKYGFRIQKSAFEARLNKKQYYDLLDMIPRYTGEDVNIRVYKLRGYGDVRCWGGEKNVMNEEVIII